MAKKEKRKEKKKHRRSILCSRFDHRRIVILVNVKPSVLRFHQVAVDWNISNSNMAAGTLPRNNVEDYRPCGDVSRSRSIQRRRSHCSTR